MHPIEKSLWTIFMAIGVITILALVALLSYFAFDAIRDVVRQRRWQYKYKHRFDKPPTAACYCKDCVYHVEKFSDGMGPCGWPGVSRWTPDNGFCYEAEPRKKDIDND